MFWERYFWMFWERYFWMFWERYFWMFWERYFWMFSEHSTKEKPCRKKQHILVRYVLKHAAGLSWFWLWAGASLLMTSLNQLKPAAMLQNIPNLFFSDREETFHEWGMMCLCSWFDNGFKDKITLNEHSNNVETTFPERSECSLLAGMSPVHFHLTV